MSRLSALIRPRWRSFGKEGFRAHRTAKQIILIIVGLVFWAGIFGVSFRVLTYFQQIEALGDIQIVCARELTKKFEEIRRENVSESIRHFTESRVLGEFIIMFHPGKDRTK